MEFSVIAKDLASSRLALLKGNMQQVSRLAFHFFIILSERSCVCEGRSF